jgi:Mrp family chromosome partitioning ATPase
MPDIDQQAEAPLQSGVSQVTRMLSIASGQGGVGKTTVAVRTCW